MVRAFERSTLRFLSLLVAGVIFTHSNVGVADDHDSTSTDTAGWTVPLTPFQASLFAPVQIFS